MKIDPHIREFGLPVECFFASYFRIASKSLVVVDFSSITPIAAPSFKIAPSAFFAPRSFLYSVVKFCESFIGGNNHFLQMSLKSQIAIQFLNGI